MELRYPIVLIIGVILIIVLMFAKNKKKLEYNDGKKIANTKYVKELAYYKKAIKKYKIITYIMKGLYALAILMSIILIARPVKFSVNNNPKYNRDIILCIDTSDSMNELNEKIIDNLKKIIKNLKGERFGISIFNTSSVTLVPLTDDYNYLLETLEKLQENLNTRIDYLNKEIAYSDRVYEATEYLQAGTTVNYETRGSSIIGDGLASCIRIFGDLEEERTRVILFSTDNELYGKELITLKEAGKLCRDRAITVFGIAPSTINPQDKISFEEVALDTGGSYYTVVEESRDSVSEIVNEIEKKGKNLIKEQKNPNFVDKPEVVFSLLSTSTICLFILNKKVNL